MSDMMQKDEVCKGCYYEERSYSVEPCKECSRAFSGMQRDWYLTNPATSKQPVSDSRTENKEFPSDLEELDKELSAYWSNAPKLCETTLKAAIEDFMETTKECMCKSKEPGAWIPIKDNDFTRCGRCGDKLKGLGVETYLTKLIDDHWSYIEALLKAHDTDKDIIEVAKFHYKSAGIHFWKHAMEYVEEGK